MGEGLTMLLLPERSLSTLDTIHCMDAEALLRGLADESVNLIIADPPYGIKYKSGTKHRIPQRIKRREDKRDSDAPRESPASFGLDRFNPSWLKEAARTLHRDGALYLCTRWDVIQQWKEAVERAGLKVVQRIVWNKAHWGAGNLEYYGSQVEDILFCVNPSGRHRLNWAKRGGNVWYIGKGRVMGKDGGGRHATQKPVDLFARMINYSSAAGDVVVDPFCGSGASLVAAQRLQRRFVGNDNQAVYVDAARSWLTNERATDPQCSNLRLEAG